MINPYANVEWATANRVPAVSHEHGKAEQTVINLYDQGIRFLPMSNYYPSEPYYPGSTFFPGINYPDLIFAPNAEQHNMGGPRVNVATRLGSSCHVCSIGSMFSAGSPQGQTPLGCAGEDWRVVYNDIISLLLYPDAGGICINHPRWSERALDVDDICNMLTSFPDDVMGVEVYNQSCEDDTQTGWAVDIWDEVLIRGLRCWGFFAADHGGEISSAHPYPRPFYGRNILLVEDLTLYECLKAYREGRFYGQLSNTDLAFDSIRLTGRVLAVTVASDDAVTIRVVIDGRATEYSGRTAEVILPESVTYVRVEAHTEGDSIYSNPIMLKAGDTPRHKVPFAVMYD